MRRKASLFIVLLWSSFSNAQLNLEKSALEIDSIGNNLFLFVQQTNIANPSSVVYTTSEFSVLIDPGFKQMQPLIMDSIRRFEGGKIKYVMLTHFHIDHSQALENYYNDALIVLTMRQYADLEEDTVKNIISSSSSLCINLGDEELDVYTLPDSAGHTGTDAIFFFKKSNVLVVGDYLFQEMYPIIDVEGGGSIEGYFSNMDYILDLADEHTKIIPGHTSFKDSTRRYLTKEEYQAYLLKLKNSIDFINTMKSSGSLLDEIIKKGLPKEYSSFNEGITYVSEKKWITNIFKSEVINRQNHH